MDSKHTPGPWKIWNGWNHSENLAAAARIGPKEGGGIMGDAAGSGRNDLYGSVPDLQLAAASPDLLDACQRVQQWLSAKWERPLSEAENTILLILEKAINKAKEGTNE